MKKKLKLTGLLLTVILAVSMFLAACGTVALPLSKPTVSLSGTTVSWDMVAGASKYEVNVDGTTHEVSALSYSLDTLNTAKSYPIKVRALGDGTLHKDSDWSNEVTFEIKADVTLSFETVGGADIDDMVVRPNTSLSLPTPVKTNYIFAGWFEDAALTTAFSATTAPTADKTLYASWITDWSEVYNYTTSGDVRTLTGLTPFGLSLSQLSIPSEIAGKPVKIINGAFASATMVTTITIPDFITSVSGTFNNAISVLIDERLVPGNSPTIPNVKAVIVKDEVLDAFKVAWTGNASKIFAKNEVNIQSNYIATADGKKFLAHIDPTAKTFSLPSGIEEIGASAFKSSALASIDFGDSLKTIGASAFDSTASLNRVVLPASLTELGASAFSSNTYIFVLKSLTAPTLNQNSFPTSGTRMIVVNSEATGYDTINWTPYSNFIIKTDDFSTGYHVTSANVLDAYYGNEAEFNMPEGVISIGSYAFVGAYELTSVIFNETVTTIGSSAFQYCGNLKSVTLPESVETIMPSAFTHLTYAVITSEAIPTAIYSFGSNTIVFVPNKQAYKDGATSANGFTVLSGRIFELADLDANGFITETEETTVYLRKYIGTGTEITIPANINVIGDKAFSSNASITKVMLGSSVHRIGSEAFSSCSALTYIDLAEVESIGTNAFNNCVGIKEIIVPSTVRELGTTIFMSWTSLQKVVFSFASLDALNEVLKVAAGNPDPWTSWVVGNTSVQVEWVGSGT